MSFGEVQLDDVKKYWDDRPCNIRHSTLPVGSLGYSREVMARKYRVEPHIPRFADFPRWEGKKVLEVGCGIGTDTISFAEFGAEVTAVDLSESSLAVARQRVEAHGLSDQVNFYQANAEDLSGVPHQQYDLIYSFGVLHHTPHPAQAFAQVGEFANSGTTVKFMVYNRMSWKVIALTKGKIWDDRAIALQSEAQTGCPVTYTYGAKEIKEILSNWFEVYSVRVDHIFPYKLEDYLQYRYEKNWWAKMPGFSLVEKALGWHLLIDARGR